MIQAFLSVIMGREFAQVLSVLDWSRAVAGFEKENHAI
jgi:hypothetical protein